MNALSFLTRGPMQQELLKHVPPHLHFCQCQSNVPRFRTGRMDCLEMKEELLRSDLYEADLMMQISQDKSSAKEWPQS